MNDFNPACLIFILFCTGIGELFFQSWLGGLTVGTGIVLLVTMLPER
jgi:hypothetical protein